MLWHDSDEARGCCLKIRQVFRGANVKLGNWRQVTVPIKQLQDKTAVTSVSPQDTHGNVYSHRLSYFVKVRKGGDFFYGKSSYENHIEGIRSSAG